MSESIKYLEKPSLWRTNGHWASWFFDHTLRANIRFIWPVGPEQLNRHVEKITGQNPKRKRPFAGHFTVVDSDGLEAIFIALGSTGDITTLAHECLHATTFLLDDRGISISRENDEIIAYTQQGLMLRCMALQKWAAKRKK